MSFYYGNKRFSANYAVGMSDTNVFKLNTFDPKPKHINFKGELTTCVFPDGTIYQTKTDGVDKFSPPIGVALCIAYYIYGSKSKFKREIAEVFPFEPGSVPVIALWIASMAYGSGGAFRKVVLEAFLRARERE